MTGFYHFSVNNGWHDTITVEINFDKMKNWLLDDEPWVLVESYDQRGREVGQSHLVNVQEGGVFTTSLPATLQLRMTTGFRTNSLSLPENLVNAGEWDAYQSTEGVRVYLFDGTVTEEGISTRFFASDLDFITVAHE